MQLEISNITMRYGSFTALDNVSVMLNSGGLTGLIGSNGAGKSTLLKIIATLLKPKSGEILLDGVNILKKPNAMRRVLGYLPQEVAVYPNLSAWEFLSYMAAVKGLPSGKAKEQISSLMSILHLSDVGKKQLSDFSGGMKQRVGIACALLGDPKVIIADEPTTGLDPQERVTLRNLLSELAESRIVILSTHIVSDVEAAASSLIVLKKGKMLFHGASDKLISLADGHVWEYTVGDMSQIPDSLAASSIVQGANGISVKSVGAVKPTENARPALPSLEDACLYAMRGDAK